MEKARASDMSAVAITDHGVMYGVVDFYGEARAHGLRPIIGCEVYVAEGSRHERRAEDRKPSNYHLVLLAADDRGYHNLIKLVSAAHLEGFYYKPRIDKQILADHAGGLIGLSSCLHGEVASRLLDSDMPRAAQAAGAYADILGKDNFYLEIQDHGIREQRQVNKLSVELSRRTGLPLVATNDVHYLEKEHAAAHEVLLCLQTQTVMSDPKRMRYQTDQFYMKSRAEMERLFGDVPEALDRTADIAERCNVELEFGRPHFPAYHAPDGLTQKEYLTRLCREGIRARYGVENCDRPRDAREREIVERFRHELAVIEKTGYINYYLVVWDFVHWARNAGIPVGPGRGSGAGSLLAYALGIVAIDPLRYGLIFERFLNPERVSPPDFDIDFCQARRGEVIDYVKGKYGRENVAQIITFGSLGAKMVIRDVGRVLEIPYGKCDQLSKMVPEDPKMTLPRALDLNPELRKAYETDDDCRRILDLGLSLEGLYRNAGTHAAGVVIGEKPLVEIIPLARDKDGEPVTQFSMEPLGEIGLLKMDFLGLKTLDVIQESVALARETRGLTVDIDNLPLDDRPTYDLLNRGDTVGVFQLESTGMRDLIRRIGINCVEDLIAMIALYRPGPMEMLPAYIERKSGKAAIAYDHPLLEPILKETYGVMVYQEQVQRAANVLAGYSLGEADILRRAMGKKKAEVMRQQRAKFVAGCEKANRIPKALAGRIFDNMESFAGYGFNKAHSTGYAVIAYQTAYLKANFPSEFMAALLSSEIGNSDKIPVFIAEAQAMGLAVLPPDVNASGVRFTPSESAVRFGLAGVKNVGAGAAEAVARERQRGGPYAGLVDFCTRLDSQLVNRKAIESLARCGAMDSLDAHRAKVFNGIEFAMARASATVRDRETGQGRLFDLLAADSPDRGVDAGLPDRPPWPQSQLLAGEKELLGMYLSGHPLAEHAPLLMRYRLADIPGAAALDDRASTRVGGIVAQLARRMTKKKEPMAVVTLEDMEGSMEVLVFPECYRQYGAALVPESAVMVCGEISRREDTPRLVAAEIYPLSEAPRLFAKRISLHIPAAGLDEQRLATVREMLRVHPGNVPVGICLLFPSGEKVFLDADESMRVTPSEELIARLQHALGEESVYVAANRQPCRNPPRERRSWERRNGNGSPRP